MFKWPLLVAATCSLLWNVAASIVQDDQNIADRNPPEDVRPQNAASEKVKHGEYLVHHVAMCVQCHSPRLKDGELDRQRLLRGAQVPVSSPYKSQQWAFRAPSLRGLPGGWTEAQLAKFLQSGQPPTAHPVLPPMPPFRLDRYDAESVAAYLKSLDE